MTHSTALQHADWLAGEAGAGGGNWNRRIADAATELRRQHAEIERLRNEPEELRRQLDIQGGMLNLMTMRRDELGAEVDQLHALLKHQQKSYEREIEIEVAAERERCAALCEQIAALYERAHEPGNEGVADYCATAIRCGRLPGSNLQSTENSHA